MKKPLLLALFTLQLSGCAITSQKMVNHSGQELECYAFGWGVIGTVVALSKQSNCEEKLRRSGYVNIEDAERLQTVAVAKPNTEPVNAPVSIGARLVIKELEERGYAFPAFAAESNMYHLIHRDTKTLPSGEILVKSVAVYKNAKLLEDDILHTGNEYYISYIIVTSIVDIENNKSRTQTIDYYSAVHDIKMTADYTNSPEKEFSKKSQMWRGLSMLGKYN